MGRSGLMSWISNDGYQAKEFKSCIAIEIATERSLQANNLAIEMARVAIPPPLKSQAVEEKLRLNNRPLRGRKSFPGEPF